MSLRHQITILTKQKRGGWVHTLRYNFWMRVAWICITLWALMAVTIVSYQGTENLMYCLSQYFHMSSNNNILGLMIW